MRLPEICIRHPVFAIVLNLLILVIGFLGYSRLDIRFFPELQQPTMEISTYFQGAAPKVIEGSVTDVIENALGGVNGIQSISSTSQNSWSTINIRFNLGGNFDQEVAQVRDKVEGVRNLLPTDANPPLFTIGGHGSAVLSLGFLDNKKTASQIRDYVDRNIQPRLRQLAGVGAVYVYGASDYAMRIWLNAEKMAALHVTVSDVETALTSNNIEFPAGTIRQPQRNYSIIADTQLTNAKQFGNIIVRAESGRVVRFRDIAKIELGNSSLQDSPMRINGKPAIDVEVKPLKSANPIDVATRVKKVLKQIELNLPPGMTLRINADQSLFLKASIHETFIAILEAILLVVLVVFLFLGSIRASLIPIITIPLCIIGAFGLLYLLNFSINIMTLLALVLAIGLVVDDAIVMLENIHRHTEMGLSPFQAAIKGSKEIGLAVIAMTITLAAVYAPIGFAQGYTAVIFKEFAFTLAGAVIISGFVALTLSPMMCSQILNKHNRPNKFMLAIDFYFEKLSNFYHQVLNYILHNRLKIIIGVLILGALGLWIYTTLPQQFIPKEDTGSISTTVNSPAGASIDYTNKYMKEIEKIYAKIPAIQSYESFVRAGSATSNVFLKPWDKRKYTTEQIIQQLSPKLAAIPGVDAFAQVNTPVQIGVGGSDIDVELMTTGSYQSLVPTMDNIMKAMRDYPGLQRIRTNLQFDKQEYSLTINRNLAGILGVDLSDIAETMRVMLGGAHLTNLDADGKSYEVILQMRKKDLANFNGLDKLYVRSSTGATPGEMIPLSSLVKLTPKIGQSNLHHYQRVRAAQITATLRPGYDMGRAVQYLQKEIPQYLKPNIRYLFGGATQEFIDSQGSMTSIFGLALIFIYLVLAAQFGSFIDPFVILLSVPLSIVGAVMTLKLSGGALSLYSEIGLVTLVGMVSKHGILITQFANEELAKGQDVITAVIAAAKTRLRPIMMTTAAMVIGSVPLALADGPGAIGRQQIGWVIVGGLTIGSFFSLIVVPIAYSLLGKFKGKLGLVTSPNT